MQIHINIGSNLGDREALLHTAVERVLDAFPGTAVCSRMIETPAWGFESEHPFLNVGVSITLREAADPLDILHTLQAIEREISSAPHRDETGGYIDRPLDIDLIAVDDIVLDSLELTLPHPRMHEREFVLVPLAETAPGWRHPLLHLTATQLLARMPRVS